jgi:hypothetical protein
MYSGTGVWAGQAHWQSTTLWKYVGSEMSVGFTAWGALSEVPREAPASLSRRRRCILKPNRNAWFAR